MGTDDKIFNMFNLNRGCQSLKIYNLNTSIRRKHVFNSFSKFDCCLLLLNVNNAQISYILFNFYLHHVLYESGECKICKVVTKINRPLKK